MTLLILSFIGGLLTVLSPCTIAVLPIILGSSVTKKDFKKPIIITISLAVSIIVFTLLLRATSALISIPQVFWTTFAGSIIIFFGIYTIFPNVWNAISYKLNLSTKADQLLNKSASLKSKEKKGFAKLVLDFLSDVLVGFSLGPVFASCSPTYAFVLATVLPVNFAEGMLNLVAYTIGLIIPMTIIALSGQTLIHIFKSKMKNNIRFRKVVKVLNLSLGIIFILVGFAIMFGIDKEIEKWLVANDILNFTGIEIELLREINE